MIRLPASKMEEMHVHTLPLAAFGGDPLIVQKDTDTMICQYDEQRPDSHPLFPNKEIRQNQNVTQMSPALTISPTLGNVTNLDPGYVTPMNAAGGSSSSTSWGGVQQGGVVQADARKKGNSVQFMDPERKHDPTNPDRLFQEMWHRTYLERQARLLETQICMQNKQQKQLTSTLQEVARAMAVNSQKQQQQPVLMASPDVMSSATGISGETGTFLFHKDQSANDVQNVLNDIQNRIPDMTQLQMQIQEGLEASKRELASQVDETRRNLESIFQQKAAGDEGEKRRSTAKVAGKADSMGHSASHGSGKHVKHVTMNTSTMSDARQPAGNNSTGGSASSSRPPSNLKGSARAAGSKFVPRARPKGKAMADGRSQFAKEVAKKQLSPPKSARSMLSEHTPRKFPPMETQMGQKALPQKEDPAALATKDVISRFDEKVAKLFGKNKVTNSGTSTGLLNDFRSARSPMAGRRLSATATRCDIGTGSGNYSATGMKFNSTVGMMRTTASAGVTIAGADSSSVPEVPSTAAPSMERLQFYQEMKQDMGKTNTFKWEEVKTDQTEKIMRQKFKIDHRNKKAVEESDRLAMASTGRMDINYKGAKTTMGASASAGSGPNSATRIPYSGENVKVPHTSIPKASSSKTSSSGRGGAPQNDPGAPKWNAVKMSTQRPAHLARIADNNESKVVKATDRNNSKQSKTDSQAEMQRRLHLGIKTFSKDQQQAKERAQKMGLTKPQPFSFDEHGNELDPLNFSVSARDARLLEQDLKEHDRRQRRLDGYSLVDHPNSSHHATAGRYIGPPQYSKASVSVAKSSKSTREYVSPREKNNEWDNDIRGPGRDPYGKYNSTSYTTRESPEKWSERLLDHVYGASSHTNPHPVKEALRKSPHAKGNFSGEQIPANYNCKRHLVGYGRSPLANASRMVSFTVGEKMSPGASPRALPKAKNPYDASLRSRSFDTFADLLNESLAPEQKYLQAKENEYDAKISDLKKKYGIDSDVTGVPDDFKKASTFNHEMLKSAINYYKTNVEKSHASVYRNEERRALHEYYLDHAQENFREKVLRETGAMIDVARMTMEKLRRENERAENILLSPRAAEQERREQEECRGPDQWDDAAVQDGSRHNAPRILAGSKTTTHEEASESGTRILQASPKILRPSPKQSDPKKQPARALYVTDLQLLESLDATSEEGAEDVMAKIEAASAKEKQVKESHYTPRSDDYTEFGMQHSTGSSAMKTNKYPEHFLRQVLKEVVSQGWEAKPERDGIRAMEVECVTPRTEKQAKLQKSPLKKETIEVVGSSGTPSEEEMKGIPVEEHIVYTEKSKYYSRQWDGKMSKMKNVVGKPSYDSGVRYQIISNSPRSMATRQQQQIERPSPRGTGIARAGKGKKKSAVWAFPGDATRPPDYEYGEEIVEERLPGFEDDPPDYDESGKMVFLSEQHQMYTEEEKRKREQRAEHEAELAKPITGMELEKFQANLLKTIQGNQPTKKDLQEFCAKEIKGEVTEFYRREKEEMAKTLSTIQTQVTEDLISHQEKTAEVLDNVQNAISTNISTKLEEFRVDVDSKLDQKLQENLMLKKKEDQQEKENKLQRMTEMMLYGMGGAENEDDYIVPEEYSIKGSLQSLDTTMQASAAQFGPISRDDGMRISGLMESIKSGFEASQSFEAGEIIPSSDEEGEIKDPNVLSRLAQAMTQPSKGQQEVPAADLQQPASSPMRALTQADRERLRAQLETQRLSSASEGEVFQYIRRLSAVEESSELLERPSAAVKAKSDGSDHGSHRSGGSGRSAGSAQQRGVQQQQLDPTQKINAFKASMEQLHEERQNAAASDLDVIDLSPGETQSPGQITDSFFNVIQQNHLGVVSDAVETITSKTHNKEQASKLSSCPSRDQMWNAGKLPSKSASERSVQSAAQRGAPVGSDQGATSGSERGGIGQAARYGITQASGAFALQVGTAGSEHGSSGRSSAARREFPSDMGTSSVDIIEMPTFAAANVVSNAIGQLVRDEGPQHGEKHSQGDKHSHHSGSDIHSVGNRGGSEKAGSERAASENFVVGKMSSRSSSKSSFKNPSDQRSNLQASFSQQVEMRSPTDFLPEDHKTKLASSLENPLENVDNSISNLVLKQAKDPDPVVLFDMGNVEGAMPRYSSNSGSSEARPSAALAMPPVQQKEQIVDSSSSGPSRPASVKQSLKDPLSASQHSANQHSGHSKPSIGKDSGAHDESGKQSPSSSSSGGAAASITIGQSVSINKPQSIDAAPKEAEADSTARHENDLTIAREADAAGREVTTACSAGRKDVPFERDSAANTMPPTGMENVNIAVNTAQPNTEARSANVPRAQLSASPKRHSVPKVGQQVRATPKQTFSSSAEEESNYDDDFEMMGDVSVEEG